jgi:hypothetical protein
MNLRSKYFEEILKFTLENIELKFKMPVRCRLIPVSDTGVIPTFLHDRTGLSREFRIICFK